MWDKLINEVAEELDDPRFANRKHYSRATYAMEDGCKGPLCRKAERDRARRRTEYKAEREGREYVANPKIRFDEEMERFLEEIVDWYLEAYQTKRAKELSEVFRGRVAANQPPVKLAVSA